MPHTSRIAADFGQCPAEGLFSSHGEEPSGSYSFLYK
jgi:hypothetical protein